MRFITRLLVCAGMILAVAGCDPADKGYFRKGIGTELYTDAIVDKTNELEIYVKEICLQAGLIYTKDGECADDSRLKRAAAWSLFVQAGMNDIDRRCDAYLVWLDNIRRAEAPTLKQLSDTHVATQLVLTATSAGIVPMALVATAFGYAADTLTNINSRLILTVNHSTVQAVVLGKQRDFRRDVLGDGNTRASIAIDNRPTAIYALRSYMRLCMPMTIETEINNTIVAYQSGGIEAYKNNPMISAVSIARSNFDVNKPIGPTSPHSKLIRNPMGDIESSLDAGRGTLIQRALCVRTQNADFGDTSSETRRNLRAFKAGLIGGVVEDQKGALETPKDRENVLDAASRFPSCVQAGFATPYEVGTLARFGTTDFRTLQLREALVKAKKEGAKDGAGEIKDELIANLAKVPTARRVMDKDVRKTIGILSAHYKTNGGDVIDYKFVDALVRQTAR